MPAQSQPTPPSSTSSNNGASPDGQQLRVVRKRNRIPLSCAPCRHRKLKCNRGHPCDNCTKRGDTTSCNYATPGSRKKGMTGPNSSPEDMQNRIDRLEGLVLSLMTTGSQPGSTAAAQAAISSSRSNSLSTSSEIRIDSGGPDTNSPIIEEELVNGEESEVEGISRDIGIMKIDNGKSVFVSNAHWYAILGEISEVKTYFASHKEDYKQQAVKVQAAKANESPGTAFLLQGTPVVDRAELLAAFPPKAEADRLIARYFNAYDPSVHIIHGPSFQKQYDKHWMNPNDTMIIWVGMCYAMMTLALQSYHRAGDEPPEYQNHALEISHTYRRLTAQCLILADITQPTPQTLETLVLHLQSEYGRSTDAEPGVLMMAGLVVRLAMRMGYHRDPEPHPAISPFMGEMRRRVWTYVRTCDLLISFQFGLPNIIKCDHMDTRAPRNLYDDELYEDMKALPPSRPSFEATPMSYMITKSKLTFLFGRIVERTQCIVDPPSYEETLKFDAELREVRSHHPLLLQMRAFQESARDPANLIMQRLGLEMTYLRSLFVLHKRFVGRGRENSRYAYSRRACLDASMELLGHQSTLHRESQDGGRLRSVKWYISSLTTHDFLVAAMLVCLDLYHVAESERKGRPPGAPSVAELYDEGRREQMLQAVEHCIGIWESVRDSSMEAYKGSIALRVMVEKLKSQPPVAEAAANNGQRTKVPAYMQKPGMRNVQFGIFPNGAVSDVNAEDLAPEQSAAMTLGMLSSGGMSPSSAFNASMNQMSNGVDKPSYPASMAALLNEPATERTGFTPRFTSPEPANGLTGLPAVNGAASPLSQLFGQSNNFAAMEGAGGDIDWAAWDSYIQGNTANAIDSGQMWPMNIDLAMDMGGQVQPAPAPGGEGVFMGATTPGASSNMM